MTEEPDRELIVLALSNRCGNEHCPYQGGRVSVAPDPYNFEMLGDETPVSLCEHCRADRAQDV